MLVSLQGAIKKIQDAIETIIKTCDSRVDQRLHAGKGLGRHETGSNEFHASKKKS